MLPDKRAAEGFIRLDPTLLETDSRLDFDIYTWPYNRPTPTLYRGRNLPLTHEHRCRLLQLSSHGIYIRQEDKVRIRAYIKESLDRIIADPYLPVVHKAEVLYHTLLQLMEDILRDPAGDHCGRAQEVIRGLLSYVEKGRQAFHQMLAITSYNYATYSHSANVCTMSVALARELDFSPKELVEFAMGALFHDVGKVKIPEEILTKRGKLTEEEWTMMKRHPEEGLAMLGPDTQLSAPARAIILQHHERLDGKGYPGGRKGNEIDPFARVVAIADVFDAMTTKRPYRDADESFPALRVMKEEVGSHLDPAYFQVFVKLLAKP